MVDGEEVPVPLRPIHGVQRAPSAPRIRPSHRMTMKTHCSVVFVVAEPRPPLGLVAGITPVPPGGAAVLWVMRTSSGFRLVVSAHQMVAGAAVPVDAAASGGHRRLAAGLSG